MHNIKIVLTGPLYVGKTTFLKCLQHWIYWKSKSDKKKEKLEFDNNPFLVPVSVGFEEFDICYDEKYLLKIIDIDSQPNLKSDRISFFENTDLVILMFSLVNRQSLEDLNNLSEEVKSVGKNLPIVILGSKKDEWEKKKKNFKDMREDNEKLEQEIEEDRENLKNELRGIKEKWEKKKKEDRKKSEKKIRTTKKEWEENRKRRREEWEERKKLLIDKSDEELKEEKENWKQLMKNDKKKFEIYLRSEKKERKEKEKEDQEQRNEEEEEKRDELRKKDKKIVKDGIIKTVKITPHLINCKKEKDVSKIFKNYLLKEIESLGF